MLNDFRHNRAQNNYSLSNLRNLRIIISFKHFPAQRKPLLCVDRAQPFPSIIQSVLALHLCLLPARIQAVITYTDGVLSNIFSKYHKGG